MNPAPLKGADGWSFTSCPYFVVEKHELNEPLQVPRDGSHFDLVVILSGEGSLKGEREALDYGQGDAFLVAANTPGLKFEPRAPTECLRVFPTGSARWVGP